MKYAEIFKNGLFLGRHLVLELWEYFLFPSSARQRIFLCVEVEECGPFTLEHFHVGPKPRVICEITCRRTYEAKGTRNNRNETRRERQRVELTICQFSHLFHRAALSTCPLHTLFRLEIHWELWLEISISSLVRSPGEHFTTVFFQVLIWPLLVDIEQIIDPHATGGRSSCDGCTNQRKQNAKKQWPVMMQRAAFFFRFLPPHQRANGRLNRLPSLDDVQQKKDEVSADLRFDVFVSTPSVLTL